MRYVKNYQINTKYLKIASVFTVTTEHVDQDTHRFQKMFEFEINVRTSTVSLYWTSASALMACNVDSCPDTASNRK